MVIWLGADYRMVGSPVEVELFVETVAFVVVERMPVVGALYWGHAFE